MVISLGDFLFQEPLPAVILFGGGLLHILTPFRMTTMKLMRKTYCLNDRNDPLMPVRSKRDFLLFGTIHIDLGTFLD